MGALFNKARNAGAVQGSSGDLEGPKQTFKGTGRTLAGGSAAVVGALSKATQALVCSRACNMVMHMAC